jgi:dTDP-4-dehydrorhamnose 3,5-epimerase-like enzyme
MKFENINIEGVKLIKNNLFFDNRGLFIKTFNSNLFENNNLNK